MRGDRRRSRGGKLGRAVLVGAAAAYLLLLVGLPLVNVYGRPSRKDSAGSEKGSRRRRRATP